RLMDLDGDDVVAGDERAGVEREGEESRLVGVDDRAGGKRGAVDGSRRHVAAADLHAVDVDDRAVVAFQVQRQVRGLGGAGDIERAAEIGRDGLVVRVWAGVDHGGLVAVAVSQLGRAGLPGAVVEAETRPVRGGRRTRVEVRPDGAGGDQGGSRDAGVV